jgi:molybdopterin converting factor small subunit
MKLKLSCGTKILFSEFEHEAPVDLESVLQSVKESHPRIYASWCDSSGRLRNSLLAFVNDEHIRYKNGIQTELRDGDEVYIVPLITGG